MRIRYANENDSSLLADLGRKTFYDSFIDGNTEEDIALYLTEHYSSEIQSSEIADTNTIILIAEINEIAVGYTKLKAQSSNEGVTATNPIELQRIYSIKEYIGKGVGAELMKASISEAKEKGFNSIWLGVWEKNERAIKFYERWGFKKVGEKNFTLGNDTQNDFTMELRLTS
jgi:GNAT superfamily N-acetyltransferase